MAERLNFRRITGNLFASFRFQLIFSMVVIFTLVITLIITDVVYRQWNILKERQKEHVMALARSLSSSSAVWLASDDIAGLQEIIDMQRGYPELKFAMLTSTTGRVLAHTDRRKTGLKVSDMPESPVYTVINCGRNLYDVAEPVWLNNTQVGWVRIGLEQKFFNEKLNSIIRSGVLYALMAIMTGIFIAWFTGKKITKRIYVIQNTANLVKSGKSGSRSNLAGNDEISLLSKEFDEMLDVLDARSGELDALNKNLNYLIDERTARLSEALSLVEKTRKELELIIDSIPGLVFLKDTHNSFLTVNKYMADTYRISKQELYGKSLYELHPVEDAERYFKDDLRIIRGRAPELNIEEIWETSEGQRTILTNKIPVFNELGEPQGILGVSIDITEKKAAEAKQAEAESRFRTMFDDSPDAYLIMDTDTGMIIDCNTATELILRAEKPQITGRTPGEVSPERQPDGRLSSDAAADYIIESLRDGKNRFEWVYRRMDGENFWADVSVSVITISGEKVLFVAWRDIEDRKQMEIAIQESRQRLSDIINFLPDATFVVDQNKVVIAWNRAMEEMSGVKAEDIIGEGDYVYTVPFYGERRKQLIDILEIDDAELESKYKHIQRKGSTLHAETFVPKVYQGKGAYVWATAAPLFDTSGKRIGSIESIRDRTELWEKEERFRILFNSSPDAYLIMEPDNGLIRDCNQAAERMLHGTRSEITGKTLAGLSPLYQPEGRLSREAAADRIAEALRDGRHRFEWIHRRFDGEDLWVDVMISVITIDRKEVLFTACRDITEKKRMENTITSMMEELERSNRELEHFAYIASHDLQEPLRMISGYVQLLARRYKGRFDPDADEFMNFAVDGAMRMQNMINALLEYARIKGRHEDLPLVESESIFINTVKNMEYIISDTGASVTHDPLPEINADANQLSQLFQNLVSNAVKFRRHDIPPVVHVSAQKEAGNWHFSVKDNGIGIDPKYHERIFKLFQRLHTRDEYPGSGIGLSVCKKIVERHGGHIWIESGAGEGTVFHFTMPAMSRSKIQAREELS